MREPLRCFRCFRRVRRCALPAALAAACLLGVVGAPAPALGQIPVTDVAHIGVSQYWHTIHYIQFALQLVRQLEQLRAQYEQIRYQLVALRKLADPNWREVASLLSDLDAVVRSGRALGYSLTDAEAQFATLFPGWRSWSDPTLYPLQAERTLDTMRAGLGAMRRQGLSFGASEQTLSAMRAQMATIGGHEQALEQLATLSVFAAQEQLLTRQALAVSGNLQAVSQAFWINREAQSQATYTAAATETALAAQRNTSPGWTFQPAWWPFF